MGPTSSNGRDQGTIVAVDVGGTCTDCVVLRDGEPIRFGKALSTPPRFALGVLESVRVTAAAMGLELCQLLARTRLFMHGSTVVDNAIFTRDGARTGLITTAGFEDTLLVTRGAYGRWSGQPEEAIKHPVASNRPASLVPYARIVGVRERVDYKGAIVQPSACACSGRSAIPSTSSASARSSIDWRRRSTWRSRRRSQRCPANTSARPPP
jgi:N-methylhydantoinase A